MKPRAIMLVLAVALAGTGCAVSHPPSTPRDEAGSVAQLTTLTAASRDLLQLPPPKGKIAVATQGASALLVKALKDSGWFVPVERENLQNLLTERKIVRALEMPQPADTPPVHMPPLLAASVLVEGGIVAYESNVRTGGAGARFLGIGMSSQYRVDQVTVNLRTVDIRAGQILQSISTTKTIYSYELHPSIFKFVSVKALVAVDSGMPGNAPAQLCVGEAIAAALGHLIVQGVREQHWALADPAQWSNPVVQRYAGEYLAAYAPPAATPAAAAAPATEQQSFTQ